MYLECNDCSRGTVKAVSIPDATASIQRTLRTGCAGVALVAAALIPAWSTAQVPRSASVATHATGTLYHAIGTGIATVVSRHSPITVRVQPFAGPPAWLPAMERGETEMGVLTSADSVFSYKGMKPYKKQFKNTRILLVGGAIQLSFYVRNDSPIKTIADLKGKRIPTEYPGIPILKLSTTAGLASFGMSYKDIVPVPVSDLRAANQAFLEGRTDANWVGLRSPMVEEGNARLGGVRWISVNGSPEGAEKMAAIYPGSYPALVKAGTATGLLNDTMMLTNDIYLVGTKDLSDDGAHAIVKALWGNTKELWDAYPALRSWQQSRMVSGKAFIPYHPGAIKFYKEQGVWNAQMDDLQAKLLAQ